MTNYRRLKEECYFANLALPEHKLIDLTFGNVSTAGTDSSLPHENPSLPGLFVRVRSFPGLHRFFPS